jgi:hypothetical protein
MIANVSRAGQPENIYVYIYTRGSLILARGTALSHFYYFCIFNGCCGARRDGTPRKHPKRTRALPFSFAGTKHQICARHDKISHVHENNYTREIDRREEGSGGAKLNQIAVDTFPKINYPASRFLPCAKLTCKLPPLCGLTGHKHPDGKKLPKLGNFFGENVNIQSP